MLGLIGSPWFERQAREHLPEELRSDLTAAPDPRVSNLVDRVAQLELLARNPALPVVPQPSLSAPEPAALQSLEARLTALDSQLASQTSRLEALSVDQSNILSQIAQGDNRLRDLYIMAVTRRMLEAGRPLGPVEPVLTARFQASDQAALDALLAWSRAPQTRETLAARLHAMEVVAEMDKTGAVGWWEALKAKLGGLVTVRGERPSQPVVDAATQFEKAKEALAGGDLLLAATTLQTLPQNAELRQWQADARLLLAAETALNNLESHALDAAIAHLPVSAAGSAQGEPTPAVTNPPF
ncbi:MAG: hypothetical protein DI568_12085 [Sphingomonas sp.]|nr:MAG: hypothetical protein DI568_12085 [Sphingomonas sp.]